MGLISDFFSASEEELDQLDTSSSPAGNLPTVQATRIDPVKLLTLQCIVDGSDFEDLVGGIDDLFVAGGDEGPWVVTVPLPIVSALAEADADRIAVLAREWAKTEEWVLDGGTPENLLPFLANIASLAREANANQSLYVWAST